MSPSFQHLKKIRKKSEEKNIQKLVMLLCAEKEIECVFHFFQHLKKMKKSERKKTNADVAVCRERGREAENNTGQSRHLRFTKSRSAHRRRNTYFGTVVFW